MISRSAFCELLSRWYIGGILLNLLPWIFFMRVIDLTLRTNGAGGASYPELALIALIPAIHFAREEERRAETIERTSA